jgi:hypothetical protein
MKMKVETPRISMINVIGVRFGIILIFEKVLSVHNITVSISRVDSFCPIVTVFSEDF